MYKIVRSKVTITTKGESMTHCSFCQCSVMAGTTQTNNRTSGAA